MLWRAIKSLSKPPIVPSFSSGEHIRCFGTSTVVMSFGDRSHGMLGLRSSFQKDAYDLGKVSRLPLDVIRVSAGHFHSLAVTSGGQVWASGHDEDAQLGRVVDLPPTNCTLGSEEMHL